MYMCKTRGLSAAIFKRLSLCFVEETMHLTRPAVLFKMFKFCFVFLQRNQEEPVCVGSSEQAGDIMLCLNTHNFFYLNFCTFFSLLFLIPYVHSKRKEKEKTSFHFFPSISGAFISHLTPLWSSPVFYYYYFFFSSDLRRKPLRRAKHHRHPQRLWELC